MAILTDIDYGMEKYCPVCGARMYAKLYPNKRLEDKWHFKMRQFCSFECAQRGGKWGRKRGKYKVSPKQRCKPGIDCFNCPYPDCINENLPMTHVESLMRKCGELPEEEPKSCTVAEIHLDINIEVSIPEEGYYE